MDSNFQKIPAEEPDPAPFETKTRMACAKIETQIHVHKIYTDIST